MHSAESGGRVLWLKLPNNVRNIPIKPQHATTAVAFASHDSLFVAGVRKHLYLWDVNTQQVSYRSFIIFFYYSCIPSGELYRTKLFAESDILKDKDISGQLSFLYYDFSLLTTVSKSSPISLCGETVAFRSEI